MIKHKRGDYSDFIVGKNYIIQETNTETYCKIMSQVFKKDSPKGYFVQYTCTYCNSGIIYDGRIDNIRKGHTWRCPECGKKYSNTKPKNIDYKRKAKSTKTNINSNNLKGKHAGEIRGTWYIQEYDHGDHQGHSFYKCLNIETGIHKITRFDQLPHKIERILTNISAGTIPPQAQSHESNGEKIVRLWLEEHNIPFEKEYPFEDLRGLNNGYLRFDFKIKNKPILIEFQGEQHYRPVEFYGGEEGFIIRQIHDKLKRNYCNKNHYKLIEIPYNYKNLDDYLIDIK